MSRPVLPMPVYERIFVYDLVDAIGSVEFSWETHVDAPEEGEPDMGEILGWSWCSSQAICRGCSATAAVVLPLRAGSGEILDRTAESACCPDCGAGMAIFEAPQGDDEWVHGDCPECGVKHAALLPHEHGHRRFWPHVACVCGAVVDPRSGEAVAEEGAS